VTHQINQLSDAAQHFGMIVRIDDAARNKGFVWTEVNDQER
jgi:hypothetical protein